MAAIATITIDSKRLEKILSRFPLRARRTIKVSLDQAALEVQNKAKINAPYLTGHLRRSITHKTHAFNAEVGSGVVYARIREFNTKRLPGGYLRPALAESQKKIRRIFERNFNKLLRP